MEQTYFPPLGKCLSGEEDLLSWTRASYLLLDDRQSSLDPRLCVFLCSIESRLLLQNAISGFPTPSPGSKSSFETKTASINVCPSPHAQYDIDEIKSDSLWLAQKANIDELSALRIVVLEWQQRPGFKLKGVYSEVELASIQSAVGSASFDISAWPVYDVSSRAGALTAARFDSVEGRRARLLSLYLSDRCHLVAVSKKLFEIVLLQISSIQNGKELSKRKAGASQDSLEELGFSILNAEKYFESQRDFEAHVISAIEAVRTRLDALEDFNDWAGDPRDPDDLGNTWVETNLQEAKTILDIITLHVRTIGRVFTSNVLLTWLRLVVKYDFFTGFQPLREQQILLKNALESSSALVTLSLFDPAGSISQLAPLIDRADNGRESNQQTWYFLDQTSINEIHQLVLHMASNGNVLASPSVFAWAMILYTIRELGLLAKEAREGHQVQKVIDQSSHTDHPAGRRSSVSSVGSYQQSLYEDLMDHVRDTSSGEDPVDYLVHSSMDRSHVFDVVSSLASGLYLETDAVGSVQRQVLQDFVTTALERLGYSPEILIAELEILSMSDERKLESTVGKLDSRMAFLNDANLMGDIFEVASSRFPYEAVPFLQLCRLLSGVPAVDNNGNHPIAERIRSLKTFTQATTPGFSAYHTIREDENANFVSLEQDLDMIDFASQPRLERGGSRDSRITSFRLPYGTIGQVISESRPTIITWQHEYSMLQYLGKWLEIYLSSRNQELTALDSVETICSEMIGLLTGLLEVIYHTNSNQLSLDEKCEKPKDVLEETSLGLDHDFDVMFVIFDIMAHELHGLKFRKTIEPSFEIILSCVDFAIMVLKIYPSRVWPAITRSGLLDIGGQDGLLISLVNSVESGLGDFILLEKSVNLYTALIENALSFAVQRTGKNASANDETDLSKDTTSHFTSQVLQSMTQMLAEVLESQHKWRFKNLRQQAYIIRDIGDAFRNIIKYTYGTDDNPNPRQKLTGMFSPAAICILDAYCPPDFDGLSATSIMTTLCDGLDSSNSVVSARLAIIRTECLETFLELCTDLLYATKQCNRPVRSLVLPLLNIFPVLIRLLLNGCPVDRPVLSLMHVLLEEHDEKQYGSLLGHLGSDSSKNFLNILGKVVNQCPASGAANTCWKVLTSLASTHQQWFSVLLLTGRSAQMALQTDLGSPEQGGPAELRGQNFLNLALENLSSIDSANPQEVVTLLEFVVRAQESWVWASKSLHAHPRFFPAIIRFVGHQSLQDNDTLACCFHNKIAALIAEVFTIYLHYAKSLQDPSIMKNMIPAITWYAENAVQVDGYNASLHTNLRKNFCMKFPNCTLASFKRTASWPANYGEDFFYNVELATRLLSYDASWMGHCKRQGQDFRSEFERANLNLSLVQSQISLLHSFKTLSIEHASFFTQDPEVQKTMSLVVRNCLLANTRVESAEIIFDNLFQTRADFALALTQQLVDVNAKGGHFTMLLPAAWEAMKGRTASFTSAMANDDLPYHRSMLTILMLAMQFHTEKQTYVQPERPATGSMTTSIDPTAKLILEIVSVIFGHGFAPAIHALLDQSENSFFDVSREAGKVPVGPRDLLLLLSILQTALRLSFFLQIQSQLSNILIMSNIIEPCLLLYAWSHKLTTAVQEASSSVIPIYGTISLRFLHSLTSLPPVAEELATGGILNRLSAARVTRLIQTSPIAISAFDSRGPEYQELYKIWSSGVLSICLNLLQGVGRAMAGEIALFLNQFPRQLSRASEAFGQSSSFMRSHGSTTPGFLSIGLVREAMTLALISHILSQYRRAGASMGVDSADIQELQGYDEQKKSLVEDIEELLHRPAALQARLGAAERKEESWLQNGTLEAMVMEELRTVAVCLGKGHDADD